MIEIKMVSKRFGSKAVLENIDLEIKKGEVHALLGTNGAGKSTLIKILAQLVMQDAGKILCNKESSLSSSSSKRIGFVFDKPLYIPYFSAKEYLEFVCRLIGLSSSEYKTRIGETINLLNLPVDHQPISSYSNGMKSKLSFATAIINSPEFLVLDEPFNGIDFISTREIIKILKNYVNSGGGVLITSHQFEIIAELATHFSVLHNSRIILSMPKSELLEKAKKSTPDFQDDEAVKYYLENIILQSSY